MDNHGQIVERYFQVVQNDDEAVPFTCLGHQVGIAVRLAFEFAQRQTGIKRTEVDGHNRVLVSDREADRSCGFVFAPDGTMLKCIGRDAYQTTESPWCVPYKDLFFAAILSFDKLRVTETHLQSPHWWADFWTGFQCNTDTLYNTSYAPR